MPKPYAMVQGFKIKQREDINPPFFVWSRKWFREQSLPHHLADVVLHIVPQCQGNLLPPPGQDVLLGLRKIVCAGCALNGSLPTDKVCQLFRCRDSSIGPRSR